MKRTIFLTVIGAMTLGLSASSFATEYRCTATIETCTKDGSSCVTKTYTTYGDVDLSGDGVYCEPLPGQPEEEPAPAGE